MQLESMPVSLLAVVGTARVQRPAGCPELHQKEVLNSKNRWACYSLAKTAITFTQTSGNLP